MIKKSIKVGGLSKNKKNTSFKKEETKFIINQDEDNDFQQLVLKQVEQKYRKKQEQLQQQNKKQKIAGQILKPLQINDIIQFQNSFKDKQKQLKFKQLTKNEKKQQKYIQSSIDSNILSEDQIKKLQQQLLDRQKKQHRIINQTQQEYQNSFIQKFKHLREHEIPLSTSDTNIFQSNIQGQLNADDGIHSQIIEQIRTDKNENQDKNNIRKEQLSNMRIIDSKSRLQLPADQIDQKHFFFEEKPIQFDHSPHLQPHIQYQLITQAEDAGNKQVISNQVGQRAFSSQIFVENSMPVITPRDICPAVQSYQNEISKQKQWNEQVKQQALRQQVIKLKKVEKQEPRENFQFATKIQKKVFNFFDDLENQQIKDRAQIAIEVISQNQNFRGLNKNQEQPGLNNNEKIHNEQARQINSNMQSIFAENGRKNPQQSAEFLLNFSQRAQQPEEILFGQLSSNGFQNSKPTMNQLFQPMEQAIIFTSVRPKPKTKKLLKKSVQNKKQLKTVSLIIESSTDFIGQFNDDLKKNQAPQTIVKQQTSKQFVSSQLPSLKPNQVQIKPLETLSSEKKKINSLANDHLVTDDYLVVQCENTHQFSQKSSPDQQNQLKDLAQSTEVSQILNKQPFIESANLKQSQPKIKSEILHFGQVQKSLIFLPQIPTQQNEKKFQETQISINGPSLGKKKKNLIPLKGKKSKSNKPKSTKQTTIKPASAIFFTYQLGQKSLQTNDLMTKKQPSSQIYENSSENFKNYHQITHQQQKKIENYSNKEQNKEQNVAINEWPQQKFQKTSYIEEESKKNQQEIKQLQHFQQSQQMNEKETPAIDAIPQSKTISQDYARGNQSSEKTDSKIEQELIEFNFSKPNLKPSVLDKRSAKKKKQTTKVPTSKIKKQTQSLILSLETEEMLEQKKSIQKAGKQSNKNQSFQENNKEQMQQQEHEANVQSKASTIQNQFQVKIEQITQQPNQIKNSIESLGDSLKSQNIPENLIEPIVKTISLTPIIENTQTIFQTLQATDNQPQAQPKLIKEKNLLALQPTLSEHENNTSQRIIQISLKPIQNKSVNTKNSIKKNTKTPKKTSKSRSIFILEKEEVEEQGSYNDIKTEKIKFPTESEPIKFNSNQILNTELRTQQQPLNIQRKQNEIFQTEIIKQVQQISLRSQQLIAAHEWHQNFQVIKRQNGDSLPENKQQQILSQQTASAQTVTQQIAQSQTIPSQVLCSSNETVQQQLVTSKNKWQEIDITEQQQLKFTKQQNIKPFKKSQKTTQKPIVSKSKINKNTKIFQINFANYDTSEIQPNLYDPNPISQSVVLQNKIPTTNIINLDSGYCKAIDSIQEKDSNQFISQIVQPLMIKKISNEQINFSKQINEKNLLSPLNNLNIKDCNFQESFSIQKSQIAQDRAPPSIVMSILKSQLELVKLNNQTNLELMRQKVKLIRQVFNQKMKKKHQRQQQLQKYLSLQSKNLAQSNQEQNFGEQNVFRQNIQLRKIVNNQISNSSILP